MSVDIYDADLVRQMVWHGGFKINCTPISLNELSHSEPYSKSDISDLHEVFLF